MQNTFYGDWNIIFSFLLYLTSLCLCDAFLFSLLLGQKEDYIIFMYLYLIQLWRVLETRPVVILTR